MTVRTRKNNPSIVSRRDLGFHLRFAAPQRAAYGEADVETSSVAGKTPSPARFLHIVERHAMLVIFGNGCREELMSRNHAVIS